MIFFPFELFILPPTPQGSRATRPSLDTPLLWTTNTMHSIV
jgi:hypothetical protein